MEYITFPQPSYSCDPETSDSEVERIQNEGEKYKGQPAEKFPSHLWIISRQAEKLLTKYMIEAAKRDQDSFGMYIYNDWSGYGLQEVIENQLTAINLLMRKKPVPAVDLWVHFSALAHWLIDTELGPWMMMDDGQRWSDTVAMIGITTLSVLNQLERANLLRKDSPLKDLGLVLALIGKFSWECFDIRGGEIPFISQEREEAWPYKIVQYGRTHNIPIVGVHGVKEKFLDEYGDEEEANMWKKKEAADRWGWGTKV